MKLIMTIFKKNLFSVKFSIIIDSSSC